MTTPFTFTVERRDQKTQARAGTITTAHGQIETPAFVTVGTKATVKGITPEAVADTGAQVVLANTFHLFLQPGEDTVARAGGLHDFMNWHGPIVTDSGGFQVFSLGAAYGDNVSKIASAGVSSETESVANSAKQVLIEEDGVFFKSPRDGSTHFLSPERSIGIQHKLGADIIFAFDECTSPNAPYEYQKEAMKRTHRWAVRSLSYHADHAAREDTQQALFGVVQGGRFEDLRRESARVIGAMDFDGYGIGGSFTKADLDSALGWIMDELPPQKPRHLLGIGEPADLFTAVEQGIDMFDCVSPTRIGRSGMLYTREGKINILNSRYQDEFRPIDPETPSYTSRNYTRAYLAHLFRSDEMLGSILASLHNIFFMVQLVGEMRTSIYEGRFSEFKESFLSTYRE